MIPLPLEDALKLVGILSATNVDDDDRWMEPTIPAGSLVDLDGRGVIELRPDVYGLWAGGHLMVRRLVAVHADGSTTWQADCSSGQALHQQTYPSGDCLVIGRVVRVRPLEEAVLDYIEAKKGPDHGVTA